MRRAEVSIVVTAWLATVSSVAAAADHDVFAGQSIQAAIDGAGSGDRVLVHPGTYLEALDLGGKSIELIGVEGAAVTIVDAGGLGAPVVELGGGGSVPRLEGLTITGGAGAGAAMKDGGGVHGGETFVTIVRCVVTGNHVTGDGGGVHLGGGSLQLEESRVVGNTAGRDGGGVWSRGDSCSLTDVVVAENVAGLGDGGGVHHARESEFLVVTAIDRCRIERNVAGARGGGLFGATATLAPFVFAWTTVRSTAMTNNAAGTEGGGAWFDTVGTISFDHVTVAGNAATGGGAGGVHAKDAVTWTVTNTIAWANTPTGLGGPKVPSVSTSDTQAAFPGPGNLSIDPQLLDLAKDDVHLALASPCRDQGAPAFSPATLDFEGDPFTADAAEDIGADELHPHLWLVGAPTLGATVELKITGPPGGGPLLLFSGAGLLGSPLPTPFGGFDLAAPVATFPLGAVPADGVFVQSFVIPVSHATGSLYVQVFTGAAVTNALVVTVTP